MFWEDGFQDRMVSNIPLIKGDFLAGKTLQLLMNAGLAIAEIIQKNRFLPVFEQACRSVGADKS